MYINLLSFVFSFSSSFHVVLRLSNLMFILYMFLLFELVTSTDFESYSNNFIPFKEIMRYNYTSKLFYKNVGMTLVKINI